MPNRLRPVAPLVLALAASCATYGRARMEFDSATGFDKVVDEPSDYVPVDEVVRWPWTVRWTEGSGFDWFLATLFGLEPAPKRVENSAEFVRERMTELTRMALGDFGRTADVGQRLLWVVARDPHPLGQIVAIESMEQLLAAMHVDPLAVPGVASDPVAAGDAVDSALERLDALAPALRAGAALDDAERRDYLAAVGVVAARPCGTASQGRRVVRTLYRAAASETDPTLLEATRRALADALACEMSNAIRVKLGSLGPYEVREAALLALVRLSGPAAVPYSLAALATRSGAGGRRYDESAAFRLTWVRLCGQLPEKWVFASYGGGPKPIEFLYDTVIGDEDEGLRLVALDAMARALGRPVSTERDWADAWWREYSLEGSDRTEGGT